MYFKIKNFNLVILSTNLTLNLSLSDPCRLCFICRTRNCCRPPSFPTTHLPHLWAFAQPGCRFPLFTEANWEAFCLTVDKPDRDFFSLLTWGSNITSSCAAWRVNLLSYLVLEKKLVESAILVFAQLPSGICITLSRGKNRAVFSEEEIGIMLTVSKDSRIVAIIV